MVSSLSSLLGGGQTSSIDSLVAQYMSLEQRPIQTLQTRKDQLSVRSAMFTDLKSRIDALKTLAEDLSTSTDSVFSAHTASSTDPDMASATASTSAASGLYLLDDIVLAKNHRVQSAQLDSEWAASGDGTFVVNGVVINLSAEDTLSDVRDAINSAVYATGRGVTASVINVDSTHSRLLLSTASTGSEYALKVADLTGNTLQSLGLATSTSSAVAISSVTASSEEVGYPGSNAMDTVTGDANSWHGAETEDEDPSWSMTLNLGSTQTVSRLVWGRDQAGASTDRVPKDYTLEYLDSDGVTWHTLKSVSGNSLSIGASKTDTFLPVSTSKIRMTVTATSDDDPPAIDEMALYNDAGTFSQTALQAPSDASLTVNGLTVTEQSSNTLTSAVSGLTIALKEEGGPVTINVAGDSTAMRSKIDYFLSRLNALFDYLKAKSVTTQDSSGNYTRGALNGYTLYTGLQSSLVGDVLNQVTGLSEGAPSRLSELGIEMDTSLHFVVKDSTKLNNWLSTSPSAVSAFFGGTSGVAKRVLDRLEPFVTDASESSKAYLSLEQEAISDQQDSIDERIKSLNGRLAIRESALRSQFTRLQALLIEATQQQERMQTLLAYSASLT